MSDSMKKRVFALGMFDGVHAGHRALIDAARSIAAELGCEPSVFTFANHPGEAFGDRVRLLMPNEERLALLKELAGDVEAVRFDAGLARKSPREFVELLLHGYGMAGAVMGFNYTFGARGLGNAELMTAYAREYGFKSRVVQRVLMNGATVSSSRIRELVERGDVAEAGELLLRDFTLSGDVVPNRRIGGSLLGFPTANISVPDGVVLPLGGVYATRARVRGVDYAAVTNIGDNPTVGGAHTSVETHIIGFSGQIYGERLTVSFLRRLRDCVKFDSVDALRRQIAADVERVKTLK